MRGTWRRKSSATTPSASAKPTEIHPVSERIQAPWAGSAHRLPAVSRMRRVRPPPRCAPQPYGAAPAGIALAIVPDSAQ